MEIYQKYIEEKIGADGNVESCKLIVPEVFNFGYDIVDKIAEEEPERTAILYCSEDGARHAITFKDMKEESDKAASYFRSLGVGKGDCVMLVLRRHYQFWFALIGLHKLGAIAVPTSFMLKTEEFTYRFEKINIKAIVCTNNDQVNSRIEEAERQSGKSFKKIIVREKRAGWLQFDEGLENAEEFVPLEVSEWPDIYDTMLIYFTSGTESQPKMVKHDFSYPIGHIPTAKYWQNVDPEGLHLTIADTGWAKSVWGKLYGQWILKAAVSVYDYSKFSPQALLTRLQEDKVTTLCAPSTIYRVLVQQDLSRYDLSHAPFLVFTASAQELTAERELFGAKALSRRAILLLSVISSSESIYTVFVSPSHLTSAPRAWAIVLTGTITLPFVMVGSTSKPNSSPFKTTFICEAAKATVPRLIINAPTKNTVKSFFFISPPPYKCHINEITTNSRAD
jgi:acetyl-CoA synthetase